MKLLIQKGEKSMKERFNIDMWKDEKIKKIEITAIEAKELQEKLLGADLISHFSLGESGGFHFDPVYSYDRALVTLQLLVNVGVKIESFCTPTKRGNSIDLQWNLKFKSLYGYLTAQFEDENFDLSKVTGKKGCTWIAEKVKNYYATCPIDGEKDA